MPLFAGLIRAALKSAAGELGKQAVTPKKRKRKKKAKSSQRDGILLGAFFLRASCAL
jgi:hypothetical protein